MLRYAWYTFFLVLCFHGDIDKDMLPLVFAREWKRKNEKKYAACQKLINYWLFPIGLIARSVRHNFTSYKIYIHRILMPRHIHSNRWLQKQWQQQQQQPWHEWTYLKASKRVNRRIKRNEMCETKTTMAIEHTHTPTDARKISFKEYTRSVLCPVKMAQDERRGWWWKRERKKSWGNLLLLLFYMAQAHTHTHIYIFCYHTHPLALV